MYDQRAHRIEKAILEVAQLMKLPLWLCRLFNLKPEPPRGSVGVKWAGDKPPTDAELDLLVMATALDRSPDAQIPGVTSIPPTPFLNYWPGEVVRHMERPNGDGRLAGVIVDAGRDYVSIQWERSDDDDPRGDNTERITDPAQLARIIKEPMPAYTQL